MALPEGAKQLAAKTLYRTWRGVAPQDPVPYGTHLPILTGLAHLVRPRRVLELGSGPLSTPLFLDRDVFPLLEHLTSVEDDEKWAAVVQHAVGDDPRLNLVMVKHVPSFISGPVDVYDLVFVDDSGNIRTRADTLTRVGDKHPTSVVVVHDFEWRRYRKVAERCFHTVVPLTGLTPQVGVMWNGERLTELEVASLGRAVAATRAAGVGVTANGAWQERMQEWAERLAR